MAARKTVTGNAAGIYQEPVKAQFFTRRVALLLLCLQLLLETFLLRHELGHLLGVAAEVCSQQCSAGPPSPDDLCSRHPRLLQHAV